MANYYEEPYDPYRDAHTAIQPVQPVQPVQSMHMSGFEQGEFSPDAPGSK